MSEQAMTVSVDSDGIALVTIDLKGQSMNVWNEALMTEFAAFVEHFCKDDARKGAVITSSKPSGFLAGADLRMLGGGGISAGASSPKEVFERLFNLNAMLRKLETSGKPAKKLMSGEASAKPVAVRSMDLRSAAGLSLRLPAITAFVPMIRKSSSASKES